VRGDVIDYNGAMMNINIVIDAGYDIDAPIIYIIIGRLI